METHHFPDDGETPNHPDFPLILARAPDAVAAEDPAAWFERCFTAHDWGATWRWGVYPYHHFHSTNHEVLGVFRGRARLILGGTAGREFEVGPGDVIVLPAGTGHKCVEASENFEVVGAYPGGEKPDLIRSGDPAIDLAAARHRIAAVPLPSSDPLAGKNGPLFDVWRR